VTIATIMIIDMAVTMRMTMVNDEDKAIAAGIASYAY
jgi:hypothetical protein